MGCTNLVCIRCEFILNRLEFQFVCPGCPVCLGSTEVNSGLGSVEVNCGVV